jgi:hypothetical protein
VYRALLLLVVSVNVWATELITYPRPESSSDRRSEYTLQLLQLALQEARVDHRLQPSAVLMRQNRSFEELAQGRTLRIAWAMTTREREASLLPIRIPISRGLIGWRLPLVRLDRAAALGQVRTLAELQALSAGQGLDWPDTNILKDNGLSVVPVSSYDNLFTMLIHGRFDYFPRSVIEIWAEAQSHEGKGVAIAPGLALHYLAADYFFVNKQDKALADDITRGLERALANGKFQRLFDAFYGAAIKQAHLAQRTVIELKNPSLPEATPLGRAELWFDPRSPGKH